MRFILKKVIVVADFFLIYQTVEKKMEENLAVIVRVRPPLDNEIILDQCVEVAHISGNKNAIKLRTKNHNITCGYDSVMGPDSTQCDVYQQVRPVVDAVCNGINATIFAYGQTGSGKTHTMLGTHLEETLSREGEIEWTADDVNEEYGIIPSKNNFFDFTSLYTIFFLLFFVILIVICDHSFYQSINCNGTFFF